MRKLRDKYRNFWIENFAIKNSKKQTKGTKNLEILICAKNWLLRETKLDKSGIRMKK